MVKTQVYLRKEELDALRMAAARSGRSVAELIRDAIRKIVLKPQAAGPVAIWDGEPNRASIEHDSVHDERADAARGSAFVDSGAWIALALSRDPPHSQAREQRELLRGAGAKLHNSVPVVIETFTCARFWS
jgi:Ribbon-helix-helix protein, copG family